MEGTAIKQKKTDFMPFDDGVRFNNHIPKNIHSVWMVERRFELGLGYVMQEPKLLSIDEAKAKGKYQNVWYYPACKKSDIIFYSENTLNDRYLVKTKLELQGKGVTDCGGDGIVVYQEELFKNNKTYWLTASALQSLKEAYFVIKNNSIG